MLIQPKLNIESNSVVTLRLVTGEEIVAKCVSYSEGDDTGFISVKKPVVIQMQMVNPQQAGIGFAPFMVSVEEDTVFRFPNSKLTCKPMLTRPDLAANYIKMTTGLEVPGAGLKI